MASEDRSGPGANRAFLRRAALFAVNNGIRQFLDLGARIPTVGSVHEAMRTAAEPGGARA
jgi:hypothetical protein